MGYPKSSLRFDRLAKWISLSYRRSKIRSICDGTNIDTQNLRNESSLTKLQIRRQVFRRGFSDPAIVSAETHSRLGTRLGDPKLFHYAQFSITCLKKNSIASTFNHCAVWLVNKSLNQSDAKSKQIAPSRFPARGTVLTFHWFLVKLSYILIGRSDYSHYNGFYDTTKGAVILKNLIFTGRTLPCKSLNEPPGCKGMESKGTIPQNNQSFITCVLFAKDGGISLNTSYAVK